ncbi:MAG: hypothetical protein Q7J56_03000 [Deltaproteobacteria bacterium]|nr:hypothetical protein [Deltaproteobacteria bacterium]
MIRAQNRHNKREADAGGSFRAAPGRHRAGLSFAQNEARAMIEVTFKDFAAIAKKRGQSPESLAELFRGKIEEPRELFDHVTGRGLNGGGSGSARTGGRGKREVWRSGVSWRERSEGASRRPQYGRDLQCAGLRAMRRKIGPRARTHGSGGEGPGAVDAVYCAPVGGPKGK